jgi:hypothetical protein
MYKYIDLNLLEELQLVQKNIDTKNYKGIIVQSV